MIGSLSLGTALAVGFHLIQGPLVVTLTAGRAPVDSGKTVKYVRSAQASFEAFRRARLPRGESHGGDCDVHIGRFCYWRGDEDEDDAPPEQPAVKASRATLIHTLDSAAAILPGDPWIAGQRIRYLVEAERTDEALAAAQQCRAEAWWCASLGGYAAHVGARFSTADSLYEIALDAMSEAQRCRWMDIRDLVDNDLERALKSADCAGREALTRKIFWLGAPLWSVSQTDLLTEHLSRMVQTRIAERAASADGAAWADDIRALVMRYGWSRWFTRNDPAFGMSMDAQITGHDKGMPYYFLPTRRTLEEGPDAKSTWTLDDARAASGYSPSFAKTVHELTSQVATFRRHDSTLVLAAWDVRRDSTLVGRELDAALVLASPSAVQTMSTSAKQRAVGHIETTAVLDSGWLSLELIAPEDRHAGRARIGVGPRPSSGRIALSDLLLYAPTEAPVTALAAVIDSTLGNAVAPYSRALGVFWETYGFAPQGENAHFSLSVEQIEIGWMQRAAERLRFSDPTTATRIQWQEFSRVADGVAGRGVRVDLSRLRAGKYRLELTITADDGATATASRDIEVRDR